MFRLITAVLCLCALLGWGCSHGAYSFQHYDFPAASTGEPEMHMNVFVCFSGPFAETSKKTIRVYAFPSADPDNAFIDDDFDLVAGALKINVEWETENQIVLNRLGENGEKQKLAEYTRSTGESKFSRRLFVEPAQ